MTGHPCDRDSYEGTNPSRAWRTGRTLASTLGSQRTSCRPGLRSFGKWLQGQGHGPRAGRPQVEQ